MPVPARPTTNADSRISLRTVSAELDFVGRYILDYTDSTPSQAEKDRIRTALFQAQADLDHVVAKLIAAVLGDPQDVPSGEQTIAPPSS